MQCIDHCNIVLHVGAVSLGVVLEAAVYFDILLYGIHLPAEVVYLTSAALVANIHAKGANLFIHALILMRL